MDTRDSNDIGKDKVTFNNFSTNDTNVHHSCFEKSVQNILPVVHNDTKVKLSCGKTKRASETFNECGECVCKIKNSDLMTCTNCELDFHVKCIDKGCLKHRNWLYNNCFSRLCNDELPFKETFINFKCSISGGSLSHISATHPCAHTSKSALKWRNAHHQILHPLMASFTRNLP